MARMGMNPARKKTSAYKPARVTVAVLVYIPHLAGYFQERLEIVKITLNSILKNTRVPFDLLVFDNGSCEEVVDYLRLLHARNQIDYLILSTRNVGKIGAFQILFEAAPGEIIAYADDDILFYPGWLEAQLEILDTYPEVGMVSGSPVRHASERARQTLETFIDSGNPNLSVSYERRIPDGWEADWAESTGRDPAQYLQSYSDCVDIILAYNEVEAFGSASHFQFLIPKEVIQKALPKQWSGQLMGRMVELDERVDQHGYLRLSTPHRYTRHMGNTISAGVAEEAQKLGLEVQPGEALIPEEKHWLLRIPGSGRVLWPLYNYLFRVLHGGN